MHSYISVVALEHIDGNFTGDGLLAGSKEPSDVEEHEDSMAVVLTPPPPHSDSEDDDQMRKRLLSEFH